MECEMCGREFEKETALWGHKASCSGEEKFTEERVNSLYHDEGLTLRETAERLGTSNTNLLYHMNRLGVKRDSRSVAKGGHAAYKDEARLRRLYWDDKFSLYEMADRLDCAMTTVLYWMDKFNIERRDRIETVKKQRAWYLTDRNGYVIIGDKSESVRLHQLLLIAAGESPHDVLQDGMDTHHKNNIPWDNRPSNLELLEHSEHQKITSNVYWRNQSYTQ